MKPTPESVHYHPAPHNCSLCEHYRTLPRDFCELLQIKVVPAGGCDRFEPRKRTTLKGMAGKGVG